MCVTALTKSFFNDAAVSGSDACRHDLFSRDADRCSSRGDEGRREMKDSVFSLQQWSAECSAMSARDVPAAAISCQREHEAANRAAHRSHSKGLQHHLSHISLISALNETTAAKLALKRYFNLMALR